MHAISIRYPHVWNILIGEKRVENRTWATNLRGTVALHASSSKGSLGKGWQKIVLMEDGDTAEELFDFGCIVGVVDIVGCVSLDALPAEYAEADCGERPCGPICWLLANPRVIDEPIAMKGLVKPWPLAVAVVKAIEVDLATAGDGEEAEEDE